MIVDAGEGRAVTRLDESIWAVAQHRERSQRQRNRSLWWLRALKLVCLVALLTKMIFWTQTAEYNLALRITVAVGAIVLAWYDATATRYGATVMFATMAFLFNPFVAVLTFAGASSFALVIAAACAFGLSLTLQSARPVFAGRG